MTKASAVAEPPVAATKEVKATKAVKEQPKEPEIVYVTSKDVAAKLGVLPTVLRRFLRTLPAFQDKQYTRYKWLPDDTFLSDIEASFKKFTETEAVKTAKRLETIRTKEEAKANAPDKPVKAKKEKKAAAATPVAVAEPEVEEDDEVVDDEFEELE